MKKLRPLLCAVLIITILSSSVTFACGKAGESDKVVLRPKDILYGDANFDSVVTINDVLTIQRYLAEYDSSIPKGVTEELYKKACIIVGNQKINIRDATAIQRFLAEFDEETIVNTAAFPWAEHVISVVRNVPDDENVVFDPVDPEVSEYLANSNYSPSDNSVSVVADYSVKSHDKPLGYQIDVPASADSVFIFDTESEQCRVEKVNSKTVAVKNVIPGKEYVYLVTDKDGVLLKKVRCKAKVGLRMINAGGNTFNIRDIGGWSCDGGTLKYGKIIRGCELNGGNYNVFVTDEQKSFFTDVLGIRDEIDLRSGKETYGVDKKPGTDDDIVASALGDSVEYVKYCVGPYTVGINPDNQNQIKLYRALIRRIVSDLSQDKPCYLHCMAGADRTGTICAIIEAICGVSQNDIDRDYELTSFADGFTRVRNDPNWTALIDRFNNTAGSSFRDKVVNYVLSMGITIDEINILRNALIDGEPEPLSAP